jgi:hypothetical protein
MCPLLLHYPRSQNMCHGVFHSLSKHLSMMPKFHRSQAGEHHENHVGENGTQGLILNNPCCDKPGTVHKGETH